MDFLTWKTGLILVGLYLLQRRGRGLRTRSKRSSRGTAMIQAGVLEMQAFLEPEKKVELLLDQDDLPTETETATDPPQPGVKK